MGKSEKSIRYIHIPSLSFYDSQLANSANLTKSSPNGQKIKSFLFRPPFWHKKEDQNIKEKSKVSSSRGIRIDMQKDWAIKEQSYGY